MKLRLCANVGLCFFYYLAKRSYFIGFSSSHYSLGLRSPNDAPEANCFHCVMNKMLFLQCIPLIQPLHYFLLPNGPNRNKMYGIMIKRCEWRSLGCTVIPGVLHGEVGVLSASSLFSIVPSFFCDIINNGATNSVYSHIEKK